jgi:phenylacetic acid degradation operon negative regulatory protein
VRLTAKSFVLDLLSTMRGGAMPVRVLVAAGERFGIEENSIRVALARLRAAGQIERDERGQYGLGIRAEAVRRRVTSWRTAHQRIVKDRPWNGTWIAVQRSARSSRLTGQRLRRRERALRFLGFRRFEPSLYLRPDNLQGGIDKVREDLQGLGLEPEALVFSLSNLDVVSEGRARGLWDVAELRAGYRLSIATLEKSERRLRDLSESEAMVESFLLGGKVIRQIVLDPLLPEPLVPAAERAALVEASLRYDRVGRSCWTRFLREREAIELQAPADTRMAGMTSGLVAAV